MTANSRRRSLLSDTAPCEPRLAPVPVPPVATLPAEASLPSAPRVKAATALPPTWLVSVYTAPGPARSPVTSASRAACSDAAGLVRLRFCSHAATATATSAMKAKCLVIERNLPSVVDHMLFVSGK